MPRLASRSPGNAAARDARPAWKTTQLPRTATLGQQAAGSAPPAPAAHLTPSSSASAGKAARAVMLVWSSSSSAVMRLSAVRDDSQAGGAILGASSDSSDRPTRRLMKERPATRDGKVREMPRNLRPAKPSAERSKYCRPVPSSPAKSTDSDCRRSKRPSCSSGAQITSCCVRGVEGGSQRQEEERHEGGRRQRRRRGSGKGEVSATGRTGGWEARARSPVSERL